MSQERVEIVRGLVTGANEDSATFWRDDQVFESIRELVAPLFDPEFESIFIWPGGVRRAYRGFDGLRDAWLDWLTPWEGYRGVLDELIDQDDRVVSLITNYGRRKGMEKEVSFKGIGIYHFQGEKIVRIEFHTVWEDGLEAAGLSDRMSSSA
jgi:SnoaL-like protein